MERIFLPQMQAALSDPLLAPELDRMGDTPHSLLADARVVLMGIPLLALFGWLAEHAGRPGPWKYRNFWDSWLLTVVLVASLVITFLSSLYSVIATSHYARRSVDSDQISGAEMTDATVRQSEVILAQYGMAQVRAWRLYLLECALRLAVLVIVVLNLVFTTMVSYTTPAPILWWMVHTFLTLVVAFVIEPRYRLLALLALGVAIGTHMRPSFGVSLIGMLGVCLFHVGQIGAVQVVRGLLQWPGYTRSNLELLVIQVAFPFACLVAMGGLFALYSFVRSKALSSL